jgi:hypothetical protein
MFANRLIIFCSFCLLLCYSQVLYAQSVKDSVSYTYDFRFNDGIFLNFEHVKANEPIPTRNIISNKNYKASNFIKEVLKEDKIKYFFNGHKTLVNKKDIWGYSSNGVLYINYDNKFYRVPNIGTISMFVAQIEQEYVSYNDPWNRAPYGSQQTVTTHSYITQFLIDFTNGQIWTFDEKNVAQLISKDQSLFEEFSSLKRRKRRQLAFSFVKRYNNKHPLLFPKN